MSRPYRVALVGAGGIGRAHAEALRGLPELFALTCVCDSDRERAAAVAGGAALESSLDKVLRRPEIEIVDVCLPPFLHFEASLKALEAGKHVVCEKPIAASLAEVDRLAAAAETSGRQLFPVFQYRFGKGFRKLERLVKAGLAGRAFTTAVETH